MGRRVSGGIGGNGEWLHAVLLQLADGCRRSDHETMAAETVLALAVAVAVGEQAGGWAWCR